MQKAEVLLLMNTKSKKTFYIFTIYGIIIFISLFLFLTIINPLVVYDTDDWLYIGQFRKPVPIIGHWNPIKVFPETFMPLVSYFGTKIINPLIHNYCFTLTLAHGFFGSILLTFYFIEFSLLFYRKQFASASLSIWYGVLFILLHFITYIHDGNNNIFLLWSQDLTCFYNYTLSAILCASFVIHSISYGGIKTLFTKSPVYKKAILVIWLYFAIFSNLFSSVILAAYIGAELVSQLFSSVTRKTFDLKEYCSNNAISLLIILFWFLSNIIETTGGRADDIGKSTLTNISSTFVFALINFVSINVFITILGIVIGFLWIRKCGRFNNVIAKCVLYFIFTIMYLLVLSATAEPYYIYRAEIVIDILFFLFICLIAAFNELIRKKRNYFRLVYILAGTTVLLLIHPGKVFYSYNNSNASYKQCEALINDIISQFHDAEESGATELTLVVPAYDVIYNWPLADFAGDNIATALYHHNITQSYISVKEITPSRTKNALFNISEFDLEKNLKEVYSVLLVE